MIRRAPRLAAWVAALLYMGCAIAAKPVVGQAAPPFTLQILNGADVTLASLRGQVVLLNYWATWCGPCKRELPLLDSYYRAAAEHGLRVFAITTEDSVPLRQMKGLTDLMAIPVVRRIRGDYGILGALPTNYIIDRAGIVRYAKAGAFELDDLNRLLIPLLQEAAPAPPSRAQ